MEDKNLVLMKFLDIEFKRGPVPLGRLPPRFWIRARSFFYFHKGMVYQECIPGVHIYV